MSLEFIDAIRDWLENRDLGKHTALPGCVIAYYPDTQLADVEPRIRVGGKKIPILSKIPVGHARTSTAFIHLPLKPGDHVLIIFNEEHTGTWRKLKGALANAGLQDRHGLNGALAIPMHYPDDSALSGLDPDKITVGFTGGSGTVRIMGDLEVTGEVTAKADNPATSVGLSTHLTPSPFGPIGPPQGGT